MKRCFQILLAFLALWGLSGPAQAGTCPDFYRFVDFGQIDASGRVVKGGPVFRVENLDGAPMLIRDRTMCLPITDLFEDGHANPIPVVSRFDYDPDKTSLDAKLLSLSATDDAVGAAGTAGNAHRKLVERPEIQTAQGPDFLCALAPADHSISCQVLSPYRADDPLFVTCRASECHMPALAFDARISVAARWQSPLADGSDPGAIGRSVSDMVRRIHDFLEAQM